MAHAIEAPASTTAEGPTSHTQNPDQQRPAGARFGDSRLPERFWKKVNITESGCWAWRANLIATGYGTYKHEGRTQLAHRVAYRSLIGQVPDGKKLDHLCHTNDRSCAGGRNCSHRRCVNPAHLEPVTTRENLLRGRTFQAANSAKTHCPQGHSYDKSNTYPIPNEGGRGCRKCRREADRRFRLRNIRKNVEVAR